MGSYKNLLLAVLLPSAILPVLAQTPTSTPDDRAVTIGVIHDPDASAPEEIVRKIPVAQPRKRGNDADDETGTDPANPRGKSDVTPGTGTPDPTPSPIPIDPGETNNPAAPGGHSPGSGPTTPEQPASPTPSTPDHTGSPPEGPKSPASKPPRPPKPDPKPSPKPEPKPHDPGHGPDHGPGHEPPPPHGPRDSPEPPRHEPHRH